MKVSWQRALEMKRWDFISVSSYWSCCCVQTHKPRSILSGFVLPGRASNRIWTGSTLCSVNLLKTPSSRDILLSHRCSSLLESAESGSASSDAAARFTKESCENTHNYCHTQTCSTQRSGLQCPASAGNFPHSSWLVANGVYCCTYLRNTSIFTDLRLFRFIRTRMPASTSNPKLNSKTKMNAVLFDHFQLKLLEASPHLWLWCFILTF